MESAKAKENSYSPTIHTSHLTCADCIADADAVLIREYILKYSEL